MPRMRAMHATRRRALEAEVLERLDAGQGEEAAVVREAVADALECRRPRW
jgi:IS5 family transposase